MKHCNITMCCIVSQLALPDYKLQLSQILAHLCSRFCGVLWVESELKSGVDPGSLPGEGAKALMTLYEMGMSDFWLTLTQIWTFQDIYCHIILEWHWTTIQGTPVSLLSALETKKPVPSARVPLSQGWAPDPVPTWISAWKLHLKVGCSNFSPVHDSIIYHTLQQQDRKSKQALGPTTNPIATR